MPVAIARASDLPVLRRLLRMGRFVYAALADEDLPAVVDKGLTLLAGEPGYPWGALIVDPELPRPASLPPEAPFRAQVRALALRHGPWASTGAAALLDGLCEHLPASRRPLLLHTYAGEPWLREQLEQAHFALADTVTFYRLASLESDADAEMPQAEGARLRPAAISEIEQIARLDAATFEPLWHFGVADIVEMYVRGRVQVAVGRVGTEEQIVGYSALLTGMRHEAHLARLAVHPAAQGARIGRWLLLDAIAYARAEGYTSMALNTQESNRRSQALYRSVGFVASGVALPVYTRLIT